MADVYVSSVAYAAIPAWQASTAYTVGQIIRPTAAAGTARYPQRCTTAGTTAGTEPGWSAGNNATTTSGTAVFTNVGGQSTYAWAAACGTVASLSNSGGRQIAAGDRMFVSSDHVESNIIGSYAMHSTVSLSSTTKIISVNKAGSTPPVEADLQSGASISVNTTFTFDAFAPTMWHGFTLTQTSANSILFNNSSKNLLVFKNCAIVISSNNSGVVLTSNAPAKVVFDNTTMQFGHASQHFRANSGLDLTWINTLSAIAGATIPTGIFIQDVSNGPAILGTFRGVDLSAITGTLVLAGTNSSSGSKMLFDSCKINASATRYGSSSSSSNPAEEVEFVNCYNGSVIINERYQPSGAVTTDTTTYMTGGAADDVGNYSHKMVSTANCEYLYPLESFWFDVENTAVGSSKTATIELVSSASLNNTDIHMVLEYEGTSGSSIKSFADSQASVLTASSALASSSAAWNSPPSTPVYQKLTVTFTPQTAGRVRARVLLGKTSKTVWVNPQVTLS